MLCLIFTCLYLVTFMLTLNLPATVSHRQFKKACRLRLHIIFPRRRTKFTATFELIHLLPLALHDNLKLRCWYSLGNNSTHSANRDFATLPSRATLSHVLGTAQGMTSQFKIVD